MAPRYGRLEAPIVFDAIQQITVSGTAAGVASIGVGPWWPTDLLAEVDAQLTTATGVAWVVSANWGEGQDGLVTIDKTPSGAYVLAWTTTPIRDALGFAGAATPSAGSQTGTLAPKGVWLPDAPYSGPTFDHQLIGHRVSNLRESIAPDGSVYYLGGRSFRRHLEVVWKAVSRARALEGASTALMSFQQFVYETQQGGAPGIHNIGSAVKFYTDADASTLLGTYQLTGLASTDLQKFVTTWNGRWTCKIPQMVVVP